MESIYQSSPLPSLPRLLNSQRPLGDSMMAYTERMREISKFRNDSAFLGSDPSTGRGTVLEVQARHIPRAGAAGGPLPGKGGGRKKPQQQQQKQQQYLKPRRPMSLDELIGRPGGGKKDEETSTSVSGRQRERRLSEPGAVSSLATATATVTATGQRAHQENADKGKRIRISFVSAADLFDLVDFSLRSRKSRSDHIKLARAEDTLKLINEANFFRSIPSRLKTRGAPAAVAAAAVAPAEREPPEDSEKASLFVHGTSSPRQSPITDNSSSSSSSSRDGGWVWQEEDGEWARREIRKNVDPYDTDDEEEDLDVDPELDLDPIRQKRMLLLQPQKLRFRPKRAKRMKLHRSLLSAIPEDERHRRESRSEHAQEVSASTRLPVMPTSSSLAAIKGSRKQGTERASSTETAKNSSHAVDANGGERSLKGDAPQSDSQPDPGDGHGHERQSRDRHQGKQVTTSQVGESQASLPSDQPPKKQRHTPKEDNSSSSSSKKNDCSRKAAAGGRGASPQNGHSQASLQPANPRVKARRKFRKLIFLRDQPDQFYHRYS